MHGQGGDGRGHGAARLGVLGLVVVTVLTSVVAGGFVDRSVRPVHATSCTGAAISTVAELQAINNNLSGSYCLVNNLDLAGVVFSPIGGSAPFTGSFDGQGYTISNLTIYLPGSSEVGLFGATVGATITHIGLQNVAVYGGDFEAGGLVGYQQGGSISQASSTGSVTGNAEVGGLVGFENGGSISQAYSTSSVSGSIEVGGLVGDQSIGTISQAYSSGSVSGNSDVGGLVGAQDGNIGLAYSTGSVFGSSTVGGLVGEQYGGAIGQAYSTGSVSGSFEVGGLVGFLQGFGASNCFWDTTTSGQSTSAAGTPESDSAMQTMATFTGAGWDFTPGTGSWSIIEGSSYPYLQALGSTVVPPTGTPTPTNPPTSTPTTTPTYAATSTAVPLTASGPIYAWGDNSYGQLGNGSNAASDVPVPVDNLTNAVSIATGGQHSVAALSDGTVWAWGWNQYYQVGDGTTTDRNIPTQVGGLTGVVAVAATYSTSLALKSDGTVWQWGFDLTDVCSGAYNLAPSRIDGLTNIVAIAAGDFFVLALRSDGTVWGLGDNSYGELGTSTAVCGPRTYSSVPVEVQNLTGVTAIAAGNEHSLAITSDGSLWTWGYNWAGELGVTTTQTCTGPLRDTGPCSNTPVQVPGLTGVRSIAGGDYFSLAVTSDGTAWSWGYNAYGQLGDGTTTNRPAPVKVSGLSGVLMVAASNDARSGLALRANGTVWAWGYNVDGELGDGTTAASTVPVQVLGLAGASAIAVGSLHALAIEPAGATPTSTPVPPTATATTTDVPPTGTMTNTPVPLATTLTSLGASTTAPVYGQTINLTATVSSALGGTPTGSVTFSDGPPSSGTPLSCTGAGDGALNQQQPDVATCTISSLAIGAHQIYASYSGGPGFAASRYSRTLTVSKDSATVLVTASTYSPAFGQTLTITTTVSSPSAGTPTGLVTVYDGDPNNGGVALGCTGASDGALNQQQPDAATCTTASLAVGVHQIYARYQGGSTFQASTNSYHRTVTVYKGSTTVLVTASSYSPAFGQTVTITTTVSNPTGGIPTGQVTAYDGDPSLGGVAIACTGAGDGVLNQLQPDVATCTTSSLTVGVHQIYARYLGDSTFLASTDTYHRTVTVYKGSTSVLVAATTYSPAFGQAVTITTSVSSPVGGIPTGLVTVYDGDPNNGGVAIACTGAGDGVLNQLQPDVAACTSSLTIGVHQIYARYLGDSTFQASTNSYHRTVTVSKASTTVLVTASSYSPVVGQTLTISTTVSSPVGGTPTGLVTTYDGDPNNGGTAIACSSSGDGTLTQQQPDVATCSSSSLAVGVHQIYARYPGDSTFLASTDTYHRTVTVRAS
jgi:alpha-tubulin suppressor-like RCC1 family protein